MAPPEQQEQAVERRTLAGSVKTMDGAAIPGATVRITHVDSGQRWETWSDEKGNFDLRSMPVGHYRIETSQLGFESVTAEYDLTAEKPGNVPVTLKIATLAAIHSANAPPAGTAVETKPVVPNPHAAQPQSQQGQPPNPQAPSQPAAAAGSGGRGGRGAPGQFAGRGGRGFQRVEVNSQGGAGEGGNEAEAQAEASGLGQAASAEAGVVVEGSTGQAQGNFGFPGMEFNPQGMSQSGGGVANASQGATGGGAQAEAGVQGLPGMVIAGGPGGGPGGRGGGGPGGFGGRGGGGGGGRGGRGGRGAMANGQQPPWGLARVMQRRINSYHFSVFDQFGDSAFDARPYSLTQINPPKEAFFTERFGGNVGGPLRIPKLYDGRDKTFVFLNVTGQVNRNAVDAFSTVPTNDERSGNFCPLGITLFDPTSSNFNGPRTALPCNISGMINPAAASLLNFASPANLTDTLNGANNFHLQSTVPSDLASVNLHVLHTINSKLNLQGTYNISQTSSKNIASFPQLIGTNSGRGQSLILGLTENFTERLLNNTTLQFTRQRTQGLNPFTETQNIAQQLGIQGVSGVPFDWNLPGISFASFTGLSDPQASLRRNQTVRLSDGVTYSRPTHTIKLGGEWRRVDFNNFVDPTPEGTFTFTGAMTEQLFNQNGNWTPLCNAPATSIFTPQQCAGYQIADLLLGFPENTNVRFSGQPTYLRSWGWVGYATDDWHVNQRFTLTYGLRYEGVTPPSDLHGRMADLVINPAFTQAAVVTAGGVSPFGGTLPAGLVYGAYKDFSPRLGFAWRVPGKFFQDRHTMVVRSGYGIFFSPTIYNTLASDLLNQPPFATAQTDRSSSSQLLTLQNGFTAAAGGAGTITNTIAIDPNYKNSYAQIWNLGIETQIEPSWLLTTTYTGTKGTHLELLFAPNQPPPGIENAPLRVTNVTGFTYENSGSNSILHSFQTRLQRRMHNGMMFQVLYTYSKSIDDASNIGGAGAGTVVQQFPLFNLERGLSPFDMRHVLTGNYYYELPFGERKKWLHNRWESAVFGNWRFNGTVSWHTGTPVTALYNAGTADFSGTGGNFSYRPNQIANANLPSDQRSLTEFFNTAAFVAPPQGVFGDAGRDTITGPGYFMLNFSLARTIAMGHDGQHRIDVRWDITNLTNTPNFTAVGNILGTPTFGQITAASTAMRQMDLWVRYNF